MDELDRRRRRLLQLAFGGCSLAIAGAIGVPVVTAFLAPGRRRTVTGSNEPIDVGRLADLAIDVPARRDVVSERRDAWDRFDPRPIGAVWLIRRAGDRVDAFSATCPHLGCAVGYDAGQRVFACPCHDSAFALDDGARLRGPSPRGLDPLPLEIKDGRVRLVYRQFVQGLAERREV